MSENTVSQSDLLLLAKASKALNDAQAAIAFVSNHLAEVYQMGPNDRFNPQTGEISRASSDNE